MATVLETTPPLCPGDFLTREEFLRRWNAAPGIKRAELIGGVVYMPSSVSIDHGRVESDGSVWLSTYRAMTPGTDSGHNATAFLGDDVVQPDIHLRILPEHGGGSWIEDSYLHGSPELVVEICKTSAAYDLHQKLDVYREARVNEFLAILLYEKEIRWHRLVDSVYHLLQPDADGVWRSPTFPGLWLDGAALIERKIDRVLATLQFGLAAPEHREFVARLSAV